MDIFRMELICTLTSDFTLYDHHENENCTHDVELKAQPPSPPSYDSHVFARR